jgi:hypothetical protein
MIGGLLLLGIWLVWLTWELRKPTKRVARAKLKKSLRLIKGGRQERE